MILTEFLFAPTVPSEPRPKKTALLTSGRLDVELAHRQRQARHVVGDPDGERVRRVVGAQRRDHRLHHGGGELLRREPVAAADHVGARAGEESPAPPLVQRGQDVEVQRLAGGARLLRAVEDGDPAGARGQRRQEVLDRERAEEANLHHSDALAARGQPLDGLTGRLGPGAHHHQHVLGLGMAAVPERAVGAAGQRLEAGHGVADDARDGGVVPVRRLARLEERVGVLRRPAQDRPVGREPAGPVVQHPLGVHHRAQRLVVERLDRRHLVRGAEAVEEVQEGHAARERRRVGDGGEVLRLLHGGRREHREARPAAGHHVRVVAEDRERVRRERARRDVHAERRQLARDLVHVRDHEQQALRRREGRRERSGLQRAVHRAGAAPASDCISSTLGTSAPQVRACPLSPIRPRSSPIGEHGVIGRCRDISLSRCATDAAALVPVDGRLGGGAHAQNSSDASPPVRALRATA
jgi:hypothetical protein